MVMQRRTDLLVLTRVYVPARALMIPCVFIKSFFGGVLELGRAVVRDAVPRSARIGLEMCIASFAN